MTKKQLVALLDDELDSSWAKAVVGYFSKSDRYRLVAEANGSAFMASVGKELPRLAIVDWELAGVPPGVADDNRGEGATGSEVVRQMITRVGNIPVLFCTKYKDVRDTGVLDPRLAYRWLEKPLKKSELPQWIETVLVPTVEAMMVEGEQRDVKPLGAALESPAVRDLLLLTPHDYWSLVSARRRQLRFAFFDAMREYVDRLFLDLDKDWVAFARLDDFVVIVEYQRAKDDPPPGVDDVRLMELRYGSPVVVVSRPARVEIVDVGGGPLTESKAGPPVPIVARRVIYSPQSE